jgi:glutamyl-tRNA synthetase
MSDHSQKVVTRFAPSPTGFMHIGGIRTALFAYLWARKNNGTFILRIEDTDKEREVEGSIQHIQNSLKWIGLDWDYGPDKPGTFGSCIQSERLDTYMEYAHKLVAKGLAYPDPYTKEQVDEFRKKADEQKRAFLFRDHRPETFEIWDGKKPLRFKVPEIKRYTWTDAVRGELSAGPEALDDFILIKADGYPTYNFAHIIDDYYMDVTHIFRADEFISSTPRFLSLYDALGFPYPVFATMPPILRDDRTKKLGKRDGAKDILEYRADGYLSETLFNFLALIGWNPGTEQEVFSKQELITAFSLDRIQKGGAVFNEEKLDWMNKEHMKLLPESERNACIHARLKTLLTTSDKLNDEVYMSKIYPLIFDRISKWGDIDTLVAEGEMGYFFEAPTYEASQLSWKGSSYTDIHTHIAWVVKNISEQSEEYFSDVEKIKSLIFDYATEQGRGSVLWPVRVALSGLDKSPDPFTLMWILGKEETVSRLQTALTLLKPLV